MKDQILKVVCLLLLLPSCIIKSPKYTSINQVMDLQVGMKRNQVESILGLKPYDVQSKTDTTNTFVYIYRLNDRRTLSFNTKPVNGKEVKGKYAPLAVTYSKDSVLLNMESCTLCQDDLMSVSKLDFQKIIMFLTITAPALLIYLGLRSSEK